MGPSVAAQTLEMYGVTHTPDSGLFDRVARLVCTFEHTKLMTAVGQHLRHEGQPVDRAIGTQCAQDLLGTQDSDQIAGTQTKSLGRWFHHRRATGHPIHFTADAKPGNASEALSA